jgi:hypothetical protein
MSATPIVGSVNLIVSSLGIQGSGGNEMVVPTAVRNTQAQIVAECFNGFCEPPSEITKSTSGNTVFLTWDSSPFSTQVQYRIKPGQAGSVPDNGSFVVSGSNSATFDIDSSNCGFFYQARLKHVCSIDSLLKSNWKHVPVIPTSSCNRQSNISEPSIFLAPNPVSEVLSVMLKNSFGKNMRLEIINIQGQVVWTKSIGFQDGESRMFKIGVENWPAGMYILRTFEHTLNSGRKFVVR